MARMSELEQRLRKDIEAQQNRVDTLRKKIEDAEVEWDFEREKLIWMRSWLEGPQAEVNPEARSKTDPEPDPEITCPECERMTRKSQLTKSGNKKDPVYLCPKCEAIMDVK